MASTPSPSSTPRELPAPLDPGAISPDRVKEIIELARWGKGSLREVLYSPDGAQVAVNTALGVYLYEANSLAQERFFPASSAASSAAFSPDWSTLAQAEGNTVRLVRLADETELLSFETEAGTLMDLKFSPDGTLLGLQLKPPGEEVYTSQIELRQVSDGSLVNTWDLQGMSWAFSPGWKTLASWDAMTGLHLWQLPGGKPLPFPGGTGMISTSAFSPDETLLATAGAPDGKVQLWQLADGSLLRSLEGEGLDVTGLAFSPDGASLAGAIREGGTHLWQVADGKLLRAFPSGPGSNELIAFSPQGTELALRSSLGLTFWRVSDATPLRSLEDHFGPLRLMAYGSGSSTAAALIVNPPSDNSTLVLRRLSEQKPFYQSEPLQALSLALSPDGSKLALGMWDGTVQILGASDGRLLNTLSGHPAQVQSVAFSPDGAVLASSSMEEVRLWRSQDGALLHALQVPGGWATDVAFSPDGGTLASFSGDGSLRLWQVSGGSLLDMSISSPEPGWEGALSFSPDGSTLALGTHLSILLWQLPSNSLPKTVTLGTPVTSLAFNPNGALLAVGLSNGTIELWKPGEDQALHVLAGHTDTVSSLSFSADGLFLLSASLDGTLRLWGLSGAR